MHTPTKPDRKPHPFGLLHRYGGISSAIIIIVVCFTGLLLNHTDDLSLSKKSVDADWLLDWYGIEAPPAVSFVFGDHYKSQLNQSIYLDSTPIQGSFAPLQGSISTSSQTLIATTHQVIVLTPAGELIETLDTLHGTPAGIERIGLLPNGQFVLEANKAMWIADSNMSEWTETNAVIKNIVWSGMAILPPAMLIAVNDHYRGAGLTFERILLDLHSGRIFGRAGVWLGDTAAIVFILLAMTGIWMWFKTRRKIT
jgi:hypothetical protein